MKTTNTETPILGKDYITDRQDTKANGKTENPTAKASKKYSKENTEMKTA
jgi:hypothetical protein